MSPDDFTDCAIAVEKYESARNGITADALSGIDSQIIKRRRNTKDVVQT
jgi:hypothetical protein